MSLVAQSCRVSPLQYAQEALSINEFTSPRWQKPYQYNPAVTLGTEVLTQRNLFTHRWWIWVDWAALIGFILLFNCIVTLFLTIFGREPRP